MVWSQMSLDAVVELSVLVLQVFGVGALCLNRLFPATRWADRGRVGAIVALVGLAIAGSVCGRLASEFALFAGVTMTVLLIGMTTGNGNTSADCTGDVRNLMGVEPNLAG
jgi:hypothetical protein